MLIIAIDLFVHLGFVDAMGLLVARNGVSSQGVASEVVVEWGTTGGKGLIAGWWLCAIIGGAWQWWLGGENGEVDEVRLRFFFSLFLLVLTQQSFSNADLEFVPLLFHHYQSLPSRYLLPTPFLPLSALLSEPQQQQILTHFTPCQPPSFPLG